MRFDPARAAGLQEREHLVGAPAATTVSPTELRGSPERPARRPRLLDVRTPAEFQTAHIPGAHNVPLDVVRERRAEIHDRLDGERRLRLPLRSARRAGGGAAARRRPGPGLRPHRAASSTGRATASTSIAAPNAGTSSDRYASSPGSIVLSSVLGSVAVPEAQMVGRRDRRWPDLCGRQQHLRDGHGPVEAALQPHRQLRRLADRAPSRGY